MCAVTKRLDPEIKVLRRLGRAIRAGYELDARARRRVFGWLSEKAYSEARKAAVIANQDREPE